MKKFVRTLRQNVSQTCCKPAAVDEDHYAYSPLPVEIGRRPGVHQDVTRIAAASDQDDILLRSDVIDKKTFEHMAEVTVHTNNVTQEETFLPLMSSTKHDYVSPREIQRTNSADPTACDTSRSFWGSGRRRTDQSSMFRRRTVQVTAQEVSLALAAINGFSTSNEEKSEESSPFGGKNALEKKGVDGFKRVTDEEENDLQALDETRAPPNTPCPTEEHEQYADPEGLPHVLSMISRDEECEEETQSSEDEERIKPAQEYAERSKRRRSSGPKGHSTPMVGSLLHLKHETINESSIYATPGSCPTNISDDAAVFDLSLQIERAAHRTQQRSTTCNILTHLAPKRRDEVEKVSGVHKPSETVDIQHVPTFQPLSEGLFGGVVNFAQQDEIVGEVLREEKARRCDDDLLLHANDLEQQRVHHPLEDLKEEEIVSEVDIVKESFKQDVLATPFTVESVVDMRNCGVDIRLKSTNSSESLDREQDFSFSIARAAALVRTGNTIVQSNQPFVPEPSSNDPSLSLVDLNGETENSRLQDESSLLMPGRSLWKTPDQGKMILKPVSLPRKQRHLSEETPPSDSTTRKCDDVATTPLFRTRKISVRPLSTVISDNILSSECSKRQQSESDQVTCPTRSMHDVIITSDDVISNLDVHDICIESIDPYHNAHLDEINFQVFSTEKTDPATFDVLTAEIKGVEQGLPNHVDKSTVSSELSCCVTGKSPALLSCVATDNNKIPSENKQKVLTRVSLEDSLLYNATIPALVNNSASLTINSTQQSTFYGEGADYCVPQRMVVKKAKEFHVDEDDLLEDVTQLSDSSLESEKGKNTEKQIISEQRSDHETQTYERKISPWQQKKFFSPIEEVSEDNATFSPLITNCNAVVPDRIPSDVLMPRMTVYSSDSADSEVWRCFKTGTPSSCDFPECSSFHDESSVFYLSTRSETALDSPLSRPGSPLPPYSRPEDALVESPSESEIERPSTRVGMFSDVPPPIPTAPLPDDDVISAISPFFKIDETGDVGYHKTTPSLLIPDHDEVFVKKSRPVTPVVERQFSFISLEKSPSTRTRKPSKTNTTSRKTVASPTVSALFEQNMVKFKNY